MFYVLIFFLSLVIGSLWNINNSLKDIYNDLHWSTSMFELTKDAVQTEGDETQEILEDLNRKIK